MKKIFLLSVVAAVAFTGCKKTMSTVSEAHHVSYPTILLSSDLYYSIPVGGTLPTITATAYDSFYREVDPVVIDQSSLDNSTPGLYAVTLSAKNKYGMTAYSSVYIGVTSASPALDLSGTYIRLATAGRVAHVSKLGTGLFMTDNVGGVNVTDPTTGAAVSAVFVVTSDTTLDLGTQLTSAGTLVAIEPQTLTLTPGDTTLNYGINLSGFGKQIRSFVKQ